VRPALVALLAVALGAGFAADSPGTGRAALTYRVFEDGAPPGLAGQVARAFAGWAAVSGSAFRAQAVTADPLAEIKVGGNVPFNPDLQARTLVWRDAAGNVITASSELNPAALPRGGALDALLLGEAGALAGLAGLSADSVTAVTAPPSRLHLAPADIAAIRAAYPAPGDVNSDGVVDFEDLALYAIQYGRTAGEDRVALTADLTGDGRVDLRDGELIATHYTFSPLDEPEAREAPAPPGEGGGQ
jgi:hypothetical protein